MLKNPFYEEIHRAEQQGAGVEALRNVLGRGRSKKGIFEGDLDQGELEIGQVSGLIRTIPDAASVLQDMIEQFQSTTRRVAGLSG